MCLWGPCRGGSQLKIYMYIYYILFIYIGKSITKIELLTTIVGFWGRKKVSPHDTFLPQKVSPHDTFFCTF